MSCCEVCHDGGEDEAAFANHPPRFIEVVPAAFPAADWAWIATKERTQQVMGRDG